MEMSKGKAILILFLMFAGFNGLRNDPTTGLFIICLALIIGFWPAMVRFFSKKNDDGQYKKYTRLIGSYRETPLDYIAESCDASQDKVVADLQEMIAKGYYVEAYFDYNRGLFIVPRNTKQRDKTVINGNVKVEKIACPFCGKMIPRTLKFCYYCGGELNQLREVEKLRKEAASTIAGALAVADDEAVKENIADIGKLADSILKKFEEEPELIDDEYKFKDQYLPRTLNAIRSYKNLCAMGNLSSDEKNLKHQIESSLDTIETAFQQILKKITIDGVYDLSADVDALHTALEQEGLTKPDFKI